MLTMLVYLLVLCIVFAVAWYIITNLLPPEVQKIARVVLVVLIAIAFCYLLVSAVGGGSGMHLSAPRLDH